MLPAIDVQNLACDMAAPGLASQEQNAPRHGHGRDGLGEGRADDLLVSIGLVMEGMKGGKRTWPERPASIGWDSAGIRI